MEICCALIVFAFILFAFVAETRCFGEKIGAIVMGGTLNFYTLVLSRIKSLEQIKEF